MPGDALRCYHTEALAMHCDTPDPVGMAAGETCNRVNAPDEGAPRGYRPRPCGGEMIDSDGVAVCDTCGETA